MAASRAAAAGERRGTVVPVALIPPPSSGAGAASSPVSASPRYDDAPGDNWPWVVEEPEDWRTRTADDSRRLRRSAWLVALFVFMAALAIGSVLDALAGRLAEMIG